MSNVSRYSWGEPSGEFEGQPIYGGDSAGMMPAVYMTDTEITNRRHPDTPEEWDLFGAHLPHEVTVIRDIEIGCKNYQALLLSGVAIQDCANCPLRRKEQRDSGSDI